MSEVEWPLGILIVGIHRGDVDIVPNGSTQIKAGDYLVVESSESTYHSIGVSMRDLCHNKETSNQNG
ncbi:TrkA C-terminal domain-containing protein [Sedimentibacter sp.]|uniref:TrkA C-terminal domain-containing protein n=1 Tax=Sedimentibacter sp. TaxID=1960295 RepID=UPI0028972F71|nr:TrkA C-terminal domain-containing protein [Sedimentibacter sp.]